MPLRRTGSWLLAVFVPVGAVLAAQQPPPSRPSVRFHHCHFSVGDPAAAMQTFADRLGGTRVVVQGYGVGVRVDRWYLLFDRDRSGNEERTVAAAAIEGARRAAGLWLAEHGLDVQADPATTVGTGDAPSLDHVGFAAGDLAAAIAVIEAHGAKPLSRTADAVTFRAPDGTAIEVLRETDAPDAYWCPMHLDIRSSGPGTCPLCAMALVRIPPPTLGEYRMEVAAEPGPGGRGLGGLTLTIAHPEIGKPIPGFTTVHERLLHLFIVSRDLEYFAHIHPEPDRNRQFHVAHQAPPGEYMVIADFLPEGGTPQMVHRAIVTPRYAGPLFARPPALTADLTAGSRRARKTIEDLQVSLEAGDLVAGRRSSLKFTLSDSAGEPVTDLEPFLGAPGHVLIVRSDLEESIHAHPEERTTRGPVVTVEPLFPSPGTYKLWAQFQRHGKVVTVPFVFDVASP